MFGQSCTQFESNEVASIRLVAKRYGQTGGGNLKTGTYLCTLDAKKSIVTCTQIAQTGAVHQSFWGVFADAVEDWSQNVLKLANQTSENKQEIAEKLSKLRGNLRTGPYNDATWLSQIRNAVNYRQDYGCWYPYRIEKPNHKKLRQQLKLWATDPLRIDQSVSSESDLIGFNNTCLFIISPCRAMLTELSERCPGKSFANYSPLAFLNLARSRANSVHALAELGT